MCIRDRYIQTALDSIFSQQTEYSFEVLIGDDYSTDGTRTLLQEYKLRYPDYIRLFLSPQNLGATRNAYNLLTNARGKYLATLEGDDYWTDSQKLQQQVDFLESHPAYVGCTHKFTVVDENNLPLKNQDLSWVVQKSTFSLNDFDGILMPGQPSTFVRRNIFLQPDCDYSICYKACLLYTSSQKQPFTGSFDGDGHSITGMSITFNSDDKSVGAPYLGLFGYVKGTADKKAEIKNLKLSGKLDITENYRKMCIRDSL